MIATSQNRPDRIGLLALMLPLSAVLLNLAASFLVPSSMSGAAKGLILASFLLVFASVPFAALVAVRSRQTDRRRMTRALIGLAMGIGFSVFFVYGTWLVNKKVRAIQEQLEIQAEQGGDGDA